VNQFLHVNPLGALQDGVTYYVETSDNGKTFQLATTQGGPALDLSATNTGGVHHFHKAGIALSAASGTQDLYLDLTARGSGGDKLLGPGDVSLRLISPPPGDGISSSEAEGGSGAFAEFSFPAASTKSTPTVNAYVNAQTVQAGGDVLIFAAAAPNLSSHADNNGGGFIHVGDASAEADVNKTTGTAASVGDGTTITTPGSFQLLATFGATTDASAHSAGGGFFAAVAADSSTEVDNALGVVVGKNAAIIQPKLPNVTLLQLQANPALAEHDTGPFGAPPPLPGDTTSIDRLNVFNDGSVSNDVGTLTGTNLSGLGISGPLMQNIGTDSSPQFITILGGITYQDVEILDVLLGQGNDNLTVNSTLTPDNTTFGGITLIHGGGGDDTLSVKPAAGSTATTVTLASPLALYGDTSQDGSEYNDIPGIPTAYGRHFPLLAGHNDTLGASASLTGVAIYGGPGNDLISGSQGDDYLAGGGGNDTIHGNGGNDLIYGDSGFNAVFYGEAGFPRRLRRRCRSRPQRRQEYTRPGGPDRQREPERFPEHGAAERSCPGQR
jgi:hypothetical protein